MRTIFISILLMLFTINTTFANNTTYKKPVRNGAGMHIKLVSTDKTIAVVSSNQRVILRNEGNDLYKVITKGNTTQLINKLDNSVVLTTKRVYIKKSRAWLNILYEPEGVAGISITLRDRPGFEHSIKPTKFFDDVRKSQEKKLVKAKKKLKKVKAKIGLDKIEATAKLNNIKLESKIDLEKAISNPDFDMNTSTEVSKAIDSSATESVSKATEKAVQEATKDTIMTATQEATLAAAVEAVEEAQDSFGDFIAAVRDYADTDGYKNLGSEYDVVEHTSNYVSADGQLSVNHITQAGVDDSFRVFNSKRDLDLRNTILEGRVDSIVDFAENEMGIDVDQSVVDTLNAAANAEDYVRISTGEMIENSLDRWSNGELNADDLNVVGRIGKDYVDAAGETVAHTIIDHDSNGYITDINIVEGETQ